MTRPSTARGYAGWIAVTLFFIAMGITSKAMSLTLVGIPTDLVNTAAPWLAIGTAILAGVLGWRGGMGRYEGWEGFIVAIVPFYVLAGYVPQFVGMIPDGGMILYNWSAWIASTTIIWILSPEY